jgi:uncharacterized protein (TIGR00251 family)
MLKITPNASTNQIIGWKENLLCIRIRGVTEKGQVNENLIDFLSTHFSIPKSHIEILSGHTSRLKRIRLSGITNQQIETRLKDV